MCTRPKLPASLETVAAFIAVCGGAKPHVLAWKVTGQRLSQAAVLRDAGQGQTVDDAEATDPAQLADRDGDAQQTFAGSAEVTSNNATLSISTVIRLLVACVTAALVIGFVLGFFVR